jgi:hypothetical protein
MKSESPALEQLASLTKVVKHKPARLKRKWAGSDTEANVTEIK